MSGDQFPHKRDPENSFTPSAMCGHSEEAAAVNQEAGSPDTLTSDFQPRDHEKEVLVICNPPNLFMVFCHSSPSG